MTVGAGAPRVPARAFGARAERPWVMFHDVRPPSSLRLKPPAPPRHRLGLVVSLVLHGLVIGVLVARGDQLFRPPAGPALFGNLAAAASGGGGGGPRVAYITLPSPPKAQASAAKPRPVAPPREVP